jgi:hypothetical protein
MLQEGEMFCWWGFTNIILFQIWQNQQILLFIALVLSLFTETDAGFHPTLSKVQLLKL